MMYACRVCIMQARELALMLLHRSLPTQPPPNTQNTTPADISHSLYTALHDLAYGSSPAVKAWASHILVQLKTLLSSTKITHTLTQGSNTTQRPVLDPPALCPDRLFVSDVVRLCEGVWGGQGIHGVLRGGPQGDNDRKQAKADIIIWLRCLSSAWRHAAQQVRHAKRAASAAGLLSGYAGAAGTPGSGAAAAPPREPHPAYLALLSALLAQPDSEMAVGAACALDALLMLAPSASLPLLPVVLYCMRRAAENTEVSEYPVRDNTAQATSRE